MKCLCFPSLIVKYLVLLISILYCCSGEDWATAAALKVLELNDASTGTIRDVPSSNKRPAATCDEMLAKAVVLAGEERALANREREEAIKASQRALVLVETANEQLKEANQKVSLLTSQLSENCRNVSLALEELKQSTKREMDALKEQTDKQLEETQNKADSMVNEALQQRDEAIALSQEEATRNITLQMQIHSDEVTLLTKKMLEEVETSQFRITQIEAEAATNMTIMNEKMNAAIAEAEQKANNRVQEVEEMAKQEVDTAQRKLIEAQTRAESLIEQVRKQSQEERNQTEYEALQKVNEANALVQKTIAEAEERIEAITKAKEEEMAAFQNNMEAQMQEIRDKSAAEIESIQRNATRLIDEATALQEKTKKEALEQIQAIKKDTSEEIDRVTSDSNHQIKSIQDVASNKIELAEKKASTLSLAVSNLRTQIQALETENTLLNEKLSATSNNLAYWESLEQPYCNFTLMKVDSIRVVKDAGTVAVKETKSALKLAQIYAENGYRKISQATQEKIRLLVDKMSDWFSAVAADPYVAQMRKQIQAWYERNLEKQVNTHIIPFYRAKVAPFLVSSSAILSEGISKVMIQIRNSWIVIIDYTRKLIAILLEKIQGSNAAKTKLPSYLISALQYAEQNTEELIVWVIKIEAFIAVVYFRAKLLRIILAVIFLPFQIAWWFCPLRFFVRFKKSPTKTTLKTDANSGTSAKPKLTTASSQKTNVPKKQ